MNAIEFFVAVVTYMLVSYGLLNGDPLMPFKLFAYVVKYLI